MIRSLSAANGWQVVLADLSLILFIATTAALGSAEPANIFRFAPSDEPTALFTSAVDGADLSDWLASYKPDPREQLTLLIRYRQGELSTGMARAAQSSEVIVQAGFSPRILIKRGDRNDMTALFAFDNDPALAEDMLARDLLEAGQQSKPALARSGAEP